MSEDMPSHPPPDDASATPPPPPAGGGTDASRDHTTAAAPAAGGQYGGLAKRFGARVIDALIVGIPLGIVLIPLAGLDARGLVYSILTAVVNLGYFVFLESSQGGTLGKRLLGMSVATTTGGRITAEQSFKRNWWLLLGIIPVLGPLLSLGVTIYIAITISSDARNQGFHDKMADALVLDR